MRRQSSVLFPLILSVLVVFFVGCSSTPEAIPEGTESAAEAIVQQPSDSVTDAEAAAQAAQLAADTARLMGELEAARGEAVAAGVSEMFPDEFGSTTSDYEALLKAQQENPDGDFRGNIESLRDTYLALAKIAKAQKLRDRIVEVGLQDADPETLQRGDEAMLNVQRLYHDGVPGSQLVEQATVAYDSYFSILSANYADLCQSQRSLAIAAKEKADSLKAEKAAKDEYAIAAKVLSDGDLSFASQDYEAAYNGFVEATRLFTGVYDDVFVRRAVADEAIRRAKQKVEASANLAAEADEIAPLADEDALVTDEESTVTDNDSTVTDNEPTVTEASVPATDEILPAVVEDTMPPAAKEMEVVQ